MGVDIKRFNISFKCGFVKYVFVSSSKGACRCLSANPANPTNFDGPKGVL